MANPKRTAQLSALVRAVGFHQPHVRTNDWLAERLLDRPLQLLSSVGPLRRLTLSVYERKVPGAFAFALARSRHGDDRLRKALEQGISQVLILGAGFDTRAARFAGQAEFFEVDFPATSEAKAARLRARLGELPTGLRLIPLDFNRQRLDEVWCHELDPRRPAIVFWEGVSFYLSPEAVEAVLAFVGRMAPGTLLVFDHLYRSTLEGRSEDAEWPRVREFMASKGEPFTFGIDPDQLGALLARHRLELREHVPPDELTRRYLTDGQGRVPYRPFASFALATAVVASGDRDVEPSPVSTDESSPSEPS